MSIIVVLIPLGLVMAGVAVWGFFWAADNDQFDDLEAQGSSLFADRNGEKDPIP